ncbi:hypothetical protein BCR43DRAFT_483843 [Syncephalastrum racemosum]|uniref:Uncharacterized protein n=1 Tax=Syncephalastrum racemosum TaxID=13706 RepID=A0A1X2HVX0_SYNRA|nr:hypothetical protein BCR43DRAFT_483843 [Syncephalastrum racemosum]
MIGNDSVFILFGVDQNGATQGDFHVLNTRTWTWTDRLQGLSPTAPNLTASSQAASQDNDNGHGASAGAIAGAVVGSVAGVAIIVGIFAFCFTRRRRETPRYQDANEKQDFESSGAAQHSSLPPPQYHLGAVDTPAIGLPYYDHQHSVSSPTEYGNESSSYAYRLSTDASSSENKPDGSRPAVDSPIRLTLQPVKPDGL